MPSAAVAAPAWCGRKSGNRCGIPFPRLNQPLAVRLRKPAVWPLKADTVRQESFPLDASSPANLVTTVFYEIQVPYWEGGT
jgi:hypothetical protein